MKNENENENEIKNQNQNQNQNENEIKNENQNENVNKNQNENENVNKNENENKNVNENKNENVNENVKMSKSKQKNKCKRKNKDKNKNLILPLKYAKVIWFFSFIHLFAGIYGLINKHYIPALLSIGAVLTSTNYWKYPLCNSWARYIDIIYIQISLYTHMYYGFYSKLNKGYFYFITIGISSYFVSNYLKENLHYSTMFHLMVHVFGSIANIVLYSDSSNILMETK